jgi:type I restriction enzyme S subunit
VAEIYDGPHATPKKIEAGPWFLSISSLRQGRLDLEESAHLSEEDYAHWTRRVAPCSGDVLFSYETRLGEAALMPDGLRACLGRRMGLLRPVRTEVHPRFLLYSYLAPTFQAEIETRAVRGATVDRIPLNELGKWPIAIPSLSVQRSIAEVLGALDDKIEANENIALSCDELASAELQSVLQTSETKGTLTMGRLGDVAVVNVRTVQPGEGGLSYLDISSVGVGRAEQPTRMTWAEAPSRARRSVTAGDVLWSTVRPNRKSHCLLLDPSPDLVVSTGFAVLTPVSVGPSFLYGVTERPEFVDYLVSVADGSAYPAVRAERFTEAPLPLPEPNLLAGYESSTMPLRERRAAAIRESHFLAELRRALLPELLSGELRIRDAETLVEEAV